MSRFSSDRADTRLTLRIDFTPSQLANAAENVGFKVFISLDFSYWNNGDTVNITQYMQKYSGHPLKCSTMVAQWLASLPVAVSTGYRSRAGTSHAIFAITNLQDPVEATYENTDCYEAFSWLA
jgi:glucan endo-1,3-alpha-glucosidase